MTTQEFSIEFDISYNNLASNAAPPLNEYEKSVFLTKAQSDIVLELYSGRNNLGLAFESSEEARNYLRPLLIHRTVPITQSNKCSITIPEDVWLITRESIGDIPVIPISQDDYYRIKDNPFRGAKKNRRALRVSNGDTDLIIHKEDQPTTGSLSYKVWGLQRPSPIILDGISDSTLTIEGEYAYQSECMLPDSLHKAILDRAVLYAKQAYVGGQAQRAQQE